MSKRIISDYFLKPKKVKPNNEPEPSTSLSTTQTSSRDSENILPEIDLNLWKGSDTDNELEDEDDEEETEIYTDLKSDYSFTISVTQSTSSSTPILSKRPGPSDISQSVTEGPTQPVLNFFKKTKFGSRFRQFKKEWYNFYSWLEYSALTDSVFCFCCRHFAVNADENTVFVNVGFKNWKRALENDSGFKKHEMSSEHKNNQVKWISFKQMSSNSANKSVASQISDAHLALVKENRTYIGVIVDILLYTATQGIGQRGHREDGASINKGNFLELLNLISKYNEIVKKKIISEDNANAKYTSPKIQNEIFLIISRMILKQISSELQRASCFSIMCDETKDIRKTEQLSVVLRYYMNGVIYERFLGFQAATELDAASLFNYIKDILVKCNIDIQKCIAQTYDGANVMSGRLNGVQTLFRNEVNRAIYVHCYNHRLNLVLVDVCKNYHYGQRFFNVLDNLYSFVSGSAVHSKFIKTQQEIQPSVKPIELKHTCYTRWTAQIFACFSVKKAFSYILVLLNRLINEQSDRATEAQGLLHQINFNFIFCLCLYTKFLTMFKGVSDYLQKVTSDIAQANVLIESLSESFKKMRNDEEHQDFTAVYLEAQSISLENAVDLPSSENLKKEKRKKKIPKKFEKYICEHLTQENLREQNDFRLHVFIPAVDLIINEIKNRFGNTNTIISGVGALHPNSTAFLRFEVLRPFAEFYNSDINLLQSELNILPNTIKKYEEENGMKIDTIMDFLDLLNIYKIAFSETYKLVVISVTIPVSSAACERTFSSLKRLKSFIRNSMTDERLNHLAVINIEAEIAKQLKTEDVVTEFDSVHNNRRILLH